ncbi:cytosine deaminase [Paenibacillus sp. H1-7]|uniref:amidohydrolase family protein n=1 Tax=Paenibacillus sp. H1-7 TaxID=2282849 RepID=UPI001EF7D490|nr:amidohydrolase family protein [Paenibacillus sp. H1-7]ULL18470.1 cytosine deaminase [Paenibacillus sp. H1-7]
MAVEVSSRLQWRIINCSIEGYESAMDIGIADGKIVRLVPSGTWTGSAEQTVDAEGGLLIPGLVESHIHLEKAHLLSRMDRKPSSLQEAIRLTAAMKKMFTREDIRERSLQVLRQAVLHGVTHLRCHVEIDPILKLDAMEVVLELKEQLRQVLDIQIVAFPQEGIFQQPGTAEWIEEAIVMGADAVGGIPYNDRDVEEHLAFVFDLAEKYGKPVDFHADFSDNPEELNIERIAAMTIERGLQGMVAAGHVTSLGSVPYDRAAAIAEHIAEAGIHIISLPATDLYLNGRGDTEKTRRGLTPIKLLMERGASVLYGTNNIRNAFTPFGTGDPLDMAWLLAHTAYMGSDEELGELLRMTTYRAAAALGIADYGIQLGCPADLVLLPVDCAAETVLSRPERRMVWKRGMVTAQSSRMQLRSGSW